MTKFGKIIYQNTIFLHLNHVFFFLIRWPVTILQSILCKCILVICNGLCSPRTGQYCLGEGGSIAYSQSTSQWVPDLLFLTPSLTTYKLCPHCVRAGPTATPALSSRSNKGLSFTQNKEGPPCIGNPSSYPIPDWINPITQGKSLMGHCVQT